MGTTESVFYDDAAAETTSPVYPRTIAAGSPLPDSSSKNARPLRTTNADLALRTKQQQQNLRRRRTPPQPKPIKRMEGLVLGCPKSGKRTLLSRLKGVDPFAEEKNSAEMNKNRERKETNSSIIIQYKPPPDSPTWDRIKLRVQHANTIEDWQQSGENGKSGTKIDFVVVLVSPKDSRETTRSYLDDTLTSYLDRLGYRTASEADDNKKTERDSASDDHSLGSREPFCIAILFNFRDLQEKLEEGNDPVVSRTDLESLVRETLRSRNVPRNKVVIELSETSLLNCYGLDGLHRFIYRTYLQRSQTDIERQLDVVRNQIQLTDGGANDAKTKSIAYDAFLKEIAPKEPIPSSQQQPPHKSDPSSKDNKQEQPAFRRLNLRKPQDHNGGGHSSSLRMGKEALEAFLASSSDEEDAKTPATHGMRFSNTAVHGLSSESDEDSDDDFFYDESGKRRHDGEGYGANDSKNNISSSDDEEPKEAQKVPPLPKVSSEDSKRTQLTNQKSHQKSQNLEETLMDNRNTRNEEETDGYQESENTRGEKIIHEPANRNVTIEDEGNVGQEDDSIEASVSSNKIEKYDHTEGNVSKKDATSNGSAREEVLDDDEDDNNNNNYEGREVDNVTDDVAEIGAANKSKSDSDDMKADNSCLEGNIDTNSEADVPHVNMDSVSDNIARNEDSVVDSDVDDAIRGVNNDVIPTSDSDDDDYVINSTPAIGIDIEDSDDDDDGYMIGSTPTIGNNKGDSDDMDKSMGSGSVDRDDDDSEFMIQSRPMEDDNTMNDAGKEDTQKNFEPSQTPSATTAVPTSAHTPAPVASGGISQAALAAIVAAQQEAEAMMRQPQQQQYSQTSSSPGNEKKSKKKKKDEKKRKKKKKTKDAEH